MATKSTPAKALDLGQLQTQVENSTRTLKAATTALKKAQEAHERAEHEYHSNQRALTAAVDQLRQSTKIV